MTLIHLLPFMGILASLIGGYFVYKLKQKEVNNASRERTQNKKIAQLEKDVAVIKSRQDSTNGEIKELKADLKEDFKELKADYKNIESMLMKLLSKG